MKSVKKLCTVSFKLDETLLESLEQIPNKSEFIRNAISVAFDSVCPVCGGTGVLSEKQKQHWKYFSKNHAVIKCDKCCEFHLSCSHDGQRNIHIL